MKHWKEHKIECSTLLAMLVTRHLVEPSVELLRDEPPAKISMRYAAAKHELALNKKLVFIFYSTDSAFAHYLFSRTEIQEPEEVQNRLLVVTLAEFRTYYVFSLHRHVRRIVEAIHACKVKESAWVSVTCMNPDVFEVTVRGGLYAPEASVPIEQSPVAPVAPLEVHTGAPEQARVEKKEDEEDAQSKQ